MEKIKDPIEYIVSRTPVNGRIFFMPNGGNLGDNLIAAGTIQRLANCGREWNFVVGTEHKISKNDVLVYGGGGSLVPIYKGGIDCLNYLKNFGNPVYVLPQTVRGHSDFWQNSGKNITVFCRDLISLSYLRENTEVDAHFADDLATGINLAADPFSGLLRLRAWHSHNEPKRTLKAFRRDQEATTATGDSSLDVSELTTPPLNSIHSIYANANLFLATIAPYSRVETNRLHVAVGAGLLGVETILHDNNYGKNSAIFNSSLYRLFPCIQMAK